MATRDTLLDPLRKIRRLARVLAALRGVGLAVAVVVAMLIASVLADYLLVLPSAPRALLLAVFLAAGAHALWRWIARPITAPLSLHDVAGRVESTHPAMRDRLRSAVDFLAGAVPGSPAMQRRVIDEARSLATTLQPGAAVDRRPVVHALLAGVLAITLAALLATWGGPAYTAIGLSRLFSPFGHDVWPKRMEIELLDAPPRRIAEGQTLELRMRLKKGDGASVRAIVHSRRGDGRPRQEVMRREADGTYALSLTATAGDSDQLNVWIEAGDDSRHLPAVTVVPRLAVVSVRALVAPPPYVHAPPADVGLSDGQATVTAGSSIALRVNFNKALADRDFIALVLVTSPAGADAAATTQPATAITWSRDGQSAVGVFTVRDSLRFRIVGTDADGLRSSGLDECQLIVEPDRPPLAQIESPRGNEHRTATAYVPLIGVAEDDFAIQSLTLSVDRLGDKRHWDIPLVADAKPAVGATWTAIDDTGRSKRFRATHQWELSALKDADLKPGDVLEYKLVATDNYALDGQTHPPAASATLRLTIISQEALADRAAEEIRRIAGRVADLKGAQERARGETEALAGETKGKGDFDAADRAVAERLAGQQGALASEGKQIAGKLDDLVTMLGENRSQSPEQSRVAADARDRVNRAAEHPMKDAATDLNAAKETKFDPAARDPKLDGAVTNQTRAADALAGALDAMGNVGTLGRMIDRVRDLIAKQRDVSTRMSEHGQKNLGKTPDQMDPKDRAELDRLAKEQDALAAETDKTLDAMDKTAEALAKSDPAAADAMRQSARTGRQQSVAPSQSKAATEARQNRQSQAKAAQNQAELGLQMMLGDLAAAESRKLEELAKKLDDLLSQVRRLIERQAGHNLDNLALRPAGAKLDIPKELPDLARRGADAGQKTPAGLSAAQEQTERNARDIARAIADSPDGGAPADEVTRAAGKMERAIIALRAADLGGAYDPSQMEALASLLRARDTLEKQKRDLEAKREKRRRDALRDVFVKARAEQLAINDLTADIENARGAEGSLPRAELIRLGALPPRQAAIADTLAKLDEDLTALGSVVFIWANQDIVSIMKAVGAALDAKQTGPSVRADQARILARLDAMIRSLAVEPPEPDKFASGHSGGGGSGAGQSSGPKLPGEVELRLLKELQIAVNQDTTSAEGAKADAAALAPIGARQADLRNLLDTLLQKASRGQVKLGPEPANENQLPEEAEASAGDPDLADLEHSLLNDAPTDDKIGKDVERIGVRMARSRQRLALNADPGPVTQTIQKHILDNLDQLIALSRKQQQQSSSGQSQSASAQGIPNPGGGRAANPQNQGAGQSQANSSNPAGESRTSPGNESKTDPSIEIQQHLTEWGGVTPRQRQAVIEAAGETVIEKYKRRVDDYYRALATQATQRP